MGYPNDILTSRAIIKHGSSALIPPEGLVNNVLPGFENCFISIVASPKMGASFVEYIITVDDNGGTTKTFATEDGVESFIYCLEGEGKCEIAGQKFDLKAGQYGYAPAGVGIDFKGANGLKLILYKQRYIELEGHKTWVVIENIENLEAKEYDGMHDLFLTELLPSDLAFDMSFLILRFKPGSSHPFIETHVQEHGAYVTEGEGAYYLDNQWLPIKKGDFIWFGPYTTQGAYGIGRGDLSYVYSKDCNRDPEI